MINNLRKCVIEAKEKVLKKKTKAMYYVNRNELRERQR